MQIGQAAKASGASAKMIRHYEAIGLIAAAERRDSNYRDYSADDVARLKFVRRARDLGFSIDRIRDLLALWGDRGRTSAEVKRIALDHVAELEERIAGMRDMVATLHLLAAVDNPGYFEGDVAKHNPFRDDVIGRPYVLDENGQVRPPEGAGLGVEVDERFLAAHPLIEGPCYV